MCINRLDIFDSSENDDNINFNQEYDQDQSEIFAAHNIKQALQTHNFEIQSDEHDCHEFFHLLMDVLDEEQQKNKISQRSLNFFNPMTMMSNSIDPLLSSSPSFIRSTSLASSLMIKNPFHGYLVCQLQCLDCNYKYPLKLESFYILSLTLPEPAQDSPESLFASISLNDCLTNYFKPEILTDVKCEYCFNNKKSDHDLQNLESNDNKKSPSKKRCFIKRQAIAKLPECLCIQIQRNSWSYKYNEMIKRTNHVKFPLSIKIDNNNRSIQQSSTFLNNSASKSFSFTQVGLGALVGGKSASSPSLNSSNNNNNSSSSKNSMNLKSHVKIIQSYQLRSAIVHYGNAHSGHFIAYRRPLNSDLLNTTNDEWLQISDSNINRVRSSTVLNSNVYMLFYDKFSQKFINTECI